MKMARAIYSTILGLVFCLSSIEGTAFPPRITNPSLIKIRNYTMAKYIDSEYVSLDCIALIEQWGYSAEEHEITTEDGYEIKAHRISGSPKHSKKKGKPVVYLQHGLMASSEVWVLRGPKQDLAFMLADAGYDVWLGNVRGNIYGRSHVTLPPDTDREFWKFSYHEIGLYDLSANIDYMLDLTKEKALIYVGHSQGTTSSYALLSSRPEYNSKIRLLISLAPVVFWRHDSLTPLLKYMFGMSDHLKKIFEDRGVYEMFPESSLSMMIGKRFCSDGSMYQSVCVGILFQLAGNGYEQLNTTMLPYLLSHFPVGASRQCICHYIQNIRQGTFQAYDYENVRENMAKYNQTEPPVYNLKNVVAPAALFYSYADPFSAAKDVKDLEKALPNVVISEAVSLRNFNHIDFLFARDVKSLLNDRIMMVINKYRFDKKIN